MYMKKSILIAAALVALVPSFAAEPVSVEITDGLDNAALKTKMELTMSSLLTEINAAQEEARNLNFGKLNLPKNVAVSLSMLWENSPFMCTDDVIVEKCLVTPNGYQIRNIPLMMTPRNDRHFNESEYQEAVISFDRKGEVESFYLSLDLNLYMQVIKSNLEVKDLRRRELILDYVEHFRTAYNQKDLPFLEQVFSDDALIITGKVIKRRSSDNIPLPDKITYKKQTKREYLTNLRRVFNANSYIRVTFDDIKVMRDGARPNYYGVTLHQGYSSSSYHDEGYVFLLWDFTDEEAPVVHVRTWQPDQFNGKPLPEDEIFSLADFDF
ncbi:nuclear transport factor 2 family protein [Candidatus Ruminimicrobium bovinum]|uniref:nuclear transport factor 2 family protein n=1 Tax=Candidatus Ruminimicrobium bovinum TaxID=3242779 RepID=UPI0039B8C9C8